MINDLEEIKRKIREQKDFLKKRYYVEKIGIFGSFSKGEQSLESDLDILVEVDGRIGWDFVELKDYLEVLLGREVDLVSIKALKPQLKEIILREVIYL